ncbi:MAG TPA: DUF4302 domain-containing protein [Chitinophagaceae bacterium]|nr:DUF4302 domain-containing protein [Chitinophagaceae bacterium]
MKNILIYISAIVSLAGCKKTTDRAFDQSPDQRLNALLANYQAQLSGAATGWKGVIISDNGKGAAYGFYFKFNDQNRVTMYSDFNSSFATTPKESSYRLKAQQQISLLFDTYSYIHVLADPDPDVADGALGEGYSVDFEFNFDEGSSNDTIKLVGRKYGNRALLVRATQQEAAAYASGGMDDGIVFNNYGSILQYWKVVTVGGVNYQLTIDSSSHSISVAWKDGGGTSHVVNTHYYYTSLGISFADAIVNGSTVITGFTNIAWNAGPRTVSVTVNGTAATIAGAANPVYVDTEAGPRWWQYAFDRNSYWRSFTGFHINGADDGYGVTSLVTSTGSFLYYMYFPGYYSDPADVFAPVMLNNNSALLNAYYTVPAPPVFRTDGRAVFTPLGDLGSIPVNGPVDRSNALLYNASGFYLVQTGPASYDMVSVADSKNWIGWEFF